MEETKNKIQTIAVLTSGGDAPGMNAAIRATVRTGLAMGLRVYGVNNGYTGLINDDMNEMTSISVSDIIGRGGTILRTSRCPEFATDAGRKRAYEVVCKRGIDALVVIGGDGSFRGAFDFSTQYPVRVIGIPGTIDNDIGCTEYTIGFDTAINTVRECMDKIKDTAFSHERCSIVEVMGRHAGFIALNCAIACDAEGCVVPEEEFDLERDVLDPIRKWRERGKRHYLLVVAEGAADSNLLAEEIRNQLGIKPTVSVLGYLQRGGSPTVKDRVTASVMGVRAVELLASGETRAVLAVKGGNVTAVPMAEAMLMKKTLDPDEVRTERFLSM